MMVVRAKTYVLIEASKRESTAWVVCIEKPYQDINSEKGKSSSHARSSSYSTDELQALLRSRLPSPHDVSWNTPRQQAF